MDIKSTSVAISMAGEGNIPVEIPLIIQPPVSADSINALKMMGVDAKLNPSSTIMLNVVCKQEGSSELDCITQFNPLNESCNESGLTIDGIPVESYEIVDLVQASTLKTLDAADLEIPSLTIHTCKIFSEVSAVMPQAILALIPGSQEDNIGLIERDFQLSCQMVDSGTSVHLKGSARSLTQLEDVIRQKLFGLSNVVDASTQTDLIEAIDSSLQCEISAPFFSKSGREVKNKSFGLDFLTATDIGAFDGVTRDDDNSDSFSDVSPMKRPLLRRARKLKNSYSRLNKGGSRNLTKPGQTETSKRPGTIKELLKKKKAEREKQNISAVEIEENFCCENSSNLPSKEETSFDNISSHDQQTIDCSLIDSVCSAVQSEMCDIDLSPSSCKLSASDEVTREEVDNIQENETTEEKFEKIAKSKVAYESRTPFRYFCSKCSFKTKRKSHLVKHLNIHDKNPNCSFYECENCTFVTMSMGNLRRHEMTHSDVIYNCKKCKYFTDNEKLLLRHYHQKHSQVSASSRLHWFTCPQCDYKTTKSALLLRHSRCHLKSAAAESGDNSIEFVETFKCSECEYATCKKEHFMRHLKCHSDQRPYLCDICGASFKRQDTLRQHKVVHMAREYRNYQHVCPHCHKAFRSTAHLADHMTRHTNIRAYLCEICGAAFKTKSVQRKHVESIHRNPRSHQCPQCEKRFNTRYALTRHVRRHDGPILMDVVDTLKTDAAHEEDEVVNDDLSNDAGPLFGTLTLDQQIQAQQISLVEPSPSHDSGGAQTVAASIIPQVFMNSAETNSVPMLYLLN